MLTIQNLAMECVGCWFWERLYAKIWALWRRCRWAPVRSGYPVTVLWTWDTSWLSSRWLWPCRTFGTQGHPSTILWSCDKRMELQWASPCKRTCWLAIFLRLMETNQCAYFGTFVSSLIKRSVEYNMTSDTFSFESCNREN